MAIHCPYCSAELSDVFERARPRIRFATVLVVVTLAIGGLYYAYGADVYSDIQAVEERARATRESAILAYRGDLDAFRLDTTERLLALNVPPEDIEGILGVVTDIERDVTGAMVGVSDGFLGFIDLAAISMLAYGLAMGSVYVVTAWGLFRGKTWAWRRLFAVTLFNVTFASILLLIGVSATLTFILVPVMLALIPMLLRPDVRTHYGVPPVTPAARAS